MRNLKVDPSQPVNPAATYVCLLPPLRRLTLSHLGPDIFEEGAVYEEVSPFRIAYLATANQDGTSSDEPIPHVPRAFELMTAETFSRDPSRH